MEPAAIARRRRPFLAPIWLAALLVVIAAVGVFEVYQSAMTTTIVVVQPAESALGSIQDAPLMLEGEQRAEHLAQLFGGTAAPGRIVAIYAAATRRTQQTAAPLAARLRIEPIVVPVEDVGGTVGRALSEHRGATVMVVSGAAWRLVEALTGATLAPPPADDYGNIYIVSLPMVGSAGVVHLRY
ncbi:MAG: phosphoglycerate mutase family protein [Steroidobacteraceae bacterium]